MRVLVATLIRRDGDKVYQYPDATQSILDLKWRGQLDHFMPSGADKQPNSIARKYEWARTMALEGGYDALLTAESDMLLPPDALERLMTAGADVAYGLYCFRQSPYHWNACSELTRFEARLWTENPESAVQRWGAIAAVKGLGLGCTLIRREVLETVTFRYHPTAQADHYFALDTALCGFNQVVDTTVICGHIVGENAVFPTNEGCLWRMQARTI